MNGDSNDSGRNSTVGLTTARLAAFYFDGIPNRIFRFRYYELVPVYNRSNSTADTITHVDTILYTLHPQLETLLRQHATSPLEWPGLFREFQDNFTKTDDTNNGSTSEIVQILPKCEVRWSWDCDPILHAYALEYQHTDCTSKTGPPPERAGIHATMVHGQAIVQSQMIPGQQILIKDQLSLYADALFIHDRGFDPETGNFIYGNQRNIPYQLQRVTSIHDSRTIVGEEEKQQDTENTNKSMTRTVVRPDMTWTLGESYRTMEEYQDKMDAMGGPTFSKPKKG